MMNKILHIILIFLFSLTVISCGSSSDSDSSTTSDNTTTTDDTTDDTTTDNTTTDTTAPVIAEVTAVTTPTNDTTPAYTFSSTEAGTITYGGNCTSSTTSASSGNNAISFSTLSEGTYSDCTIMVTDSAANVSSALTVSSFTIDTTAPSVSSFTLSDTALKTGETATVTLVFSEAVASFASGDDITVANGSLAAMTSSDNITVTFSEAMDTTYVTTSTSDTYCAGTIRVSSNNFSSCVKMSSEPVSSNSNRTFTLDPYDNLTVGTTYKTRVTTGVKDTAGNSMSSQYETSSGFTPADLTAPTVTFSPTDNATGVVEISYNITISFNEAVRNIDDSVLTDSDLGSLITLKLNSASGDNVTFDATVNSDKTVITIDPTSNLFYSQTVYVAIGATVEDSADNVITATSSTYTTEQTPATAPNGSGSSGDPYLISNLAELSYISQNMGTTDYWAADVYLKQTANIDASATQYWDDADGDSDGDLYNDTNDITSTGSNEGFSPIGNLSTRFYGNYDGDNFTISGMTINRTYPSTGNEIGMFGWAQNGTIKDLTLSNMVVTATSVASFYGVGMLMGGGGSGIISNITISGGSLTSSGSYGYVGPLAGRYSKGTISNSTSSASVSFTYTGSSSTSNIGGLIGYISASSDNYTISNSSATGSVTVSNTSGNVTRVGGFAGTLSGTGTVDRCFSSGSVTSNNGGYVGGFVGNAYNVDITDSYTVSNLSVASTSSVGGFFSSSPTASSSQPTFTRTYAAGTITGGSAGGFGGQSNYTNTYTDSFWDTDTTGNTIAVPNDKEGNLTGKTTAEMKTLATFTDIATTGLSTTWDFDTIWNIDTSGTINNGYPYLR